MKLKRVRAGIAFGNTRKENFLFNLRIRVLKEFLRCFILRSNGSREVQMLLLARHIHTHTQRIVGACICIGIVYVYM
jgi:hypothetical protein